MALKVKVSTDTSKKWEAMIATKEDQIAGAANGALRETVSKATEEGWRDILTANAFLAASGATNPFWQNLKEGWRYIITGDTGEGGKKSLQTQPKAIIFHRSRIAAAFEFGGTIRGKPLLWIPTTRGAPSASQSGKKLVSATVRGTPMLFDAGDRDRERKPLYIGVPQVQVRKTFHLIEIVKKRVAQIASVFGKRFKGD